MNITHRDPREASMVQMSRHLSGDLETAGKRARKGLESSKLARGLLKVMGVLAVTVCHILIHPPQFAAILTELISSS
jgi:KUP system potassium uptake protein